MNRPPALRLLIFLVLLVGLGACKDGGCGKKADEIPATPAARVEQMTAKLPTKSDTVIIAKDLEALRQTLGVIKERLPYTGIVDTMQKQVQVAFGIDVLDAASWQRAGVAPNSSMVVAVYRSRLIFLMYVENRQAFEKTLVEKAKSAFSIEAVTKSEKVGKHPIKVLSDDPARQIAWMYQGKLALISMPALDNQGALEDGSAKMILGELADSKKESSIWSDAGFQSFRAALVENYPVAAWANPRKGLESEEAKKRISEDPNAKAMAAWAEKNVTFLGAGLQAKGDQATVRGYIGLKPDVLKNLRASQNPETKHTWDALATEKVLLGGRLSVNVAQAYALISESLPDDQRRSMKRSLKGFGDNFGSRHREGRHRGARRACRPVRLRYRQLEPARADEREEPRRRVEHGGAADGAQVQER